ncbi:MAG: class I SAM-dependent methyltransferase [Bacteroidales bacterium]|nr:class I SAM-dependent methyltransferase [Bacteroidales bacterium]HOI31191.1 class I SAM-dependent methyltransferase [Bacteroidales bacterium]
MQLFWDERFSGEAYIYGETPNEFFKSTLQNLPAGKLLLPGEGEGRNAVWAATAGWEVVAVDYSSSGKAKALKLAQKNQVHLDYRIEDLSVLKFPEKSFDVIALIFVHLPVGVRKQVHQELVRMLKPNGLVIMEAFHKDQLQYNSGGPKNAEMNYDSAMIKSDFDTLQIKQLTELHANLNEGKWHYGKAALVRFIGQKI